MERFNALGRGAQMMLVAGVLLFVDLFLSWQKVDLPAPFDDYTRSGWYGAAGIILGLLTVVLLAWLIVRLASVDIPLPVSTAMTAALIATLLLIFAVIKFLSILGDEQTIWAWIGLILAIVVAAGAFQVVQEAGGMENLRTEASAVTTARAGGGEAPAPTPDAPPEPPAPPTEAASPPAMQAPASPAEPASAAPDAAADAGTAMPEESAAPEPSGAEEPPGDAPEDAPRPA